MIFPVSAPPTANNSHGFFIPMLNSSIIQNVGNAMPRISSTAPPENFLLHPFAVHPVDRGSIFSRFENDLPDALCQHLIEQVAIVRTSIPSKVPEEALPASPR